METIVINNTEWITSVWWQDIKAKGLKDAYRQAKFHYKKNAKKSYDGFCILESGGKHQAGYVLRDTDLPMANQKALAALFAAKYDNCAVRLVFKTGVWVCAIGDGLVEPDSDVFGTEDDAERAFKEFFPLRDWDEILEIDDPEKSAELIRTLSEEGLNVAELRPVARQLNKKQIGKVAGGAILLLAVLFAGKLYINYQEKVKRAAEDARKAEILRKLDEQNYQKQLDQLQFKKVWESEPSAQAVFKFCYSEMKSFPLVDKGWRLGTLTCTQKSLEAKWKRLDYARLTNLPAKAVFDVNDPTAKQAISEWSRQMSTDLPKRKAGVELLSKPEGAANLYQIARDYQFAISASWPKPEVRTIPARNPKEKPRTIESPYSKCIWTMTGAYCPEISMLEIITGLPGMMVKEVIHEYEKGQWILKGEFYVQ